jgi:hypothetical protein
MRAMNTAAGFSTHGRNQLWAEAANTATYLDTIIVKPSINKTPYELFYGRQASFAPYLRTFGEVGVIRHNQSIKRKLDYRGATCIFIGYTTQHSGNVYRMLDLKTKTVKVSRDITWLDQNIRRIHESRE